MKLLQELCEAPGISGREHAIIDIMTRELQHTVDHVTVDQMGNVLGFKKGQKEQPKKVIVLDFGIKFNTANGGPAPEKITEATTYNHRETPNTSSGTRIRMSCLTVT